MKYQLQNLARRPVSIICSNGKAMHLPPKYSCEVEQSLVANNAMIKKLADRHLISVTPKAEKVKAKTTSVKKAPRKKATVKKKTSAKKVTSAKKKTS